MQAYALRVMEQCSGTTSVIKCFVFIIFVFFGAVIVFVIFITFLGWSPARGFRTSLFPEFVHWTYLDFVSIVVSSRWLEKVPSCKTVFGEN